MWTNWENPFLSLLVIRTFMGSQTSEPGSFDYDYFSLLENSHPWDRETKLT
jgi:hypothetical protein